jgi:hypothetical protein
MFNTMLSKSILVALALALGIYLVSAALAGSVTASFASAEADRQAKRTASASKADLLAAEYKLARAECRQLTGEARVTCTRDALRVQRHAAAEVRADSDCRLRAGGAPATVEPPSSRAAGRMDIALYRAHRQLLP